MRAADVAARRHRVHGFDDRRPRDYQRLLRCLGGGDRGRDMTAGSRRFATQPVPVGEVLPRNHFALRVARLCEALGRRLVEFDRFPSRS